MADKEKSMLTKFWGSPSSAEPLHIIRDTVIVLYRTGTEQYTVYSATPNVDRHERRGESMHALNILLLTERSSLRERDREKAESLPITKSPVLARDCLSLEADHGSGGGA